MMGASHWTAGAACCLTLACLVALGCGTSKRSAATSDVGAGGNGGTAGAGGSGGIAGMDGGGARSGNSASGGQEANGGGAGLTNAGGAAGTTLTHECSLELGDHAEDCDEPCPIETDALIRCDD